MKSMNVEEMRNTEGGIGLFTALVALYIGGSVGISARISYEHGKYGRCITYPKKCNTCKRR